jgi:hypothetical protein
MTPPLEDDAQLADVDDLDPAVTLDLRGTRARLVTTDGDLVMLVDDGDVQVEFDSGADGTWEQAVQGAQRVASTALAFAEAIRAQRQQ